MSRKAREARAAEISAQRSKLATVELLADDANSRVRRVRVMDGLERAFRRGFLRAHDDLYRVGRCLQEDMLALLPRGGSWPIERLRRGMSEDFALMPRGGGLRDARHVYREDALDRLRRAEIACGATDFRALRAWLLEDCGLAEVARRRRVRRADIGELLARALERIDDGAWNDRRRRREPVYDERKWRVDVWAEAR